MAIENPFKKLSKPELYAVIGGSALLLGYMEYRRHKATGSWNPFTKGINNGASDTIDTLTGLPASQDNITDPVTGMTYLAEAQQYGSVQAAEASVSAYGQSPATGSGIPVNPASPQGGGSPPPVVTSSVYTTNAAWAQAATAGLASVGYSQTDVATALGAYLTGTPLTPDQVKLVNTARAEYGPPPSDLPVIPAPPAQPAPPPVGPPSSGGTVPQAKKPGVPRVTASAVSATSVRISWNKDPNATSYEAYVTYQGAEIGRHSSTGTTAVITGLTPNHTYTPHVIATGPGGSAAGQGTGVKTP